MEKMEKHSYHHGDLKAHLIEEGLRLLNAQGYDAFSMRGVARACGVSQTAPYRHFRDKDALISAITQQAMDAFWEHLETAVAAYPNDPKAGLKAMGVAYVRFFYDNPKYLQLLFLSGIGKETAGDENTRKAHRQEGHPFAALYFAVRRYKEVYPDDDRSEDELLLYCWGLVHGISVLIAGGDLPIDGDPIELMECILTSERFL